MLLAVFQSTKNENLRMIPCRHVTLFMIYITWCAGDADSDG